MYKIIQFSDGSELMAEESDNVEIELFKDNAIPVQATYTPNKPDFKKGKHIIRGDKTIVDLSQDKPHNKAKDPHEATNQGMN